MTEEYPEREPFHFHRFVRLLHKTCAAHDIGPASAYLLTIIAGTEDAARYRRGVTYYDFQLENIMGVGSYGALSRARKRAIKSGWLHYKPGGKGRAGIYWTLIPAHAEGLDDNPTDEGDDLRHRLLLQNGGANEEQTKNKRRANGEQTESNRRASGVLSDLTLSPTLSLSLNTSIDASPEAERLYQAYPRTQAKGAALKAIRRALTKDTFDVLAEAVAAFAESRRGEDPQFTPHPATWFNQERWNDDRSTWTRSAGAVLSDKTRKTMDAAAAFVNSRQTGEPNAVSE